MASHRSALHRPLLHRPLRHRPGPGRSGLAATCALAAAWASAGCMFSTPQPGVMISSDPPGAVVRVDGQDSGFVTPARIDLERGEWHTLGLELPGYLSAERQLAPGLRRNAVGWEKGFVGPQTFTFPLFLPLEDLFVPVRLDDSLAPSRLHVKLQLNEAERIENAPAAERRATDASGADDSAEVAAPPEPER